LKPQFGGKEMEAKLCTCGR